MQRTTSIALACATAALTHTAGAQNERQVQIGSIDFENGIIELINFAGTDQDLSRWRFCSHDFNQARVYSGSNGLNGVTIEAGTSLFIHFNNDAPANDPDRLNRATIGSFAGPLDQDAYGIQIYRPDSNGNISFGNSSLIADHVQWNIGGSGVGSAEFRTSQAVGQGLWTANGDFVATEADSASLWLTDLSGDEAGGPDEYAVVRANTVHNEALDGDLSDDPAAPNALVLALGSNVVEGEVNLSNDTSEGDRDFLTFSVPAGQTLSGLTLLNWNPDNPGFIAVNAGDTGFIPGFGTDANFLAGILVDNANEGDNLLENLQNQAVTQKSLAQPSLPAGEYTFVIQQTSDLTQSYALDFILSEADEVCLPDVNMNGSVEPTDFGAWLAAFNAGDPAADQNLDGDVTPTDFGAWLANFNAGCD